MLKAYNQEETLDEKELASDREFLSDAYFFLKERTGVNLSLIHISEPTRPY